MPSEPQFQYSIPFADELNQVIQRVLAWGDSDRSGPIDLSGFQSLVAIKNSERTITTENDLFRAAIMGGKSSVGWTTDRALSPKFLKISQAVDDLILDGAASVELEHVGALADGRACTFITHKRRLDELKDPSFLVLLVSRPLNLIGDTETERRRTLSELVTMLNQLDSTDRTICDAYAKGDPTKAIANLVGLTTRSVEIRRQKIMDTFGFSRPIEIIKMMVRLEERGLI